MPASNLTNLTELTSVVPTDLLYLVDDPGGTPISKKVEAGNVLTALDSGAKIVNTANIGTSNTVPKILTFNSEIYDTDNYHSLVSNTERLTIPYDGLYLIIGHLAWSNGTSGIRRASILTSDTTVIGRGANSGGSTATPLCCGIALEWLTAGDYVRLEAYQNGGLFMDVTYLSNFRSPCFEIQRIL